MASKVKTYYCCKNCGNESANWAGKCPFCGEWNSLVEVTGIKKGVAGINGSVPSLLTPKRINEIEDSFDSRIETGISEFDRVLGGGAVTGSLILVGGAPGIGKSTLLLQMCNTIEAKTTILYVSGEESERQLKLRAVRLQVTNSNLYIISAVNITDIINLCQNLKPNVIIVDSVQTLYDPGVESAPGSISQIRECTIKIMRLSKESNVPIFLVGHINKEGNIAGPKILEHMVDCVIYFEGERNTYFRILRAIKNRFGSTNEIGVFEMTDKGLKCVENPSKLLLTGRPLNASGTCVTCVVQGSRPILAEIQALVSTSSANYSSKRSNGFDFNRLAMLIAVLDKRGSIPVSNCDSYVNVIGGLTLDEPAADLATTLSLASSFFDKPIDDDLVAIGEVGLSGEIRSVSMISNRLNEAARLGFKKCVVSSNEKINEDDFPNLNIIRVESLMGAVRATIGKK